MHCRHQSLDHLAQKSETQSLPFLESWMVMLVEETRYKATCFGPIIPGYEAYCVPLDSLHHVDALLEVWVPDDGSVLQERSDDC